MRGLVFSPRLQLRLLLLMDSDGYVVIIIIARSGKYHNTLFVRLNFE